MTKTRLKPCPFCGAEAEIIGEDEYQVICMECDGSIDRFFDTEEEAAKDWNCRSSENELTGKIGKLEAENKRLREALERIVSECPACFEDADCPHNGGAGYDQGCLRCPWVIADVALEKEQK